MIRIGRKTFVKDSIIHCCGYEIFIKYSCWAIHLNGEYVKADYDSLEECIKYCMENQNESNN